MGTYTLKATTVSPQTTTHVRITLTTHAVGDLVVCIPHLLAGTQHFTGASDSNGRISWHEYKVVGITGPGANTNTIEIWYGVVASVGSTVVTFTHSGSTGFDGWIVVQEWATSLSSPTWHVQTSGSYGGRTSTGYTVDFPTLKSGATGGFYIGWCYPETTGEIPTTHQGFTWKITNTQTSVATNILVWRKTLAASTTYAPVGKQKGSNDYYDNVAAIFYATGTTPGPSPTSPPERPAVVSQAAQRAATY
jgi:hypothetical protein